MFQNYTLKAKKFFQWTHFPVSDTALFLRDGQENGRYIYSSALRSCPSLWRYSSEAEITAFMKLDIIYLLVLLQFINQCAPNQASNLFNPSVPLRTLLHSLNLQLIKHEALTRTRRVELVRLRLCKIVVESFKCLEVKIFLKKCETNFKWYVKFGWLSKSRSLVLKCLSTCSSLSDGGQRSDVTDGFDVIDYSPF